MRRIKKEKCRQLPVALVDKNGAVTGAALQAEDTYVILSFAVDLATRGGGMASGMIAQGFINSAGNFEFQPGESTSSRYELRNNPDLSPPMADFLDFVVWCGGEAMRDVTPMKFLDYIADVKCWLPHAELTPGSPAWQLQARGFEHIKDFNYACEAAWAHPDYKNLDLRKVTKAELTVMAKEKA